MILIFYGSTDMKKKFAIGLISFIAALSSAYAYLEDVYVPKGWRVMHNNYETRYVTKANKNHYVTLMIFPVSEFISSINQKNKRQEEYNASRILSNRAKCKTMETRETYQYLKDCEVYPETLTSYAMVKMHKDRVFFTGVVCDNSNEDPEINECAQAKKIIDSFDIFNQPYDF